jgi:hypothetical protein
MSIRSAMALGAKSRLSPSGADRLPDAQQPGVLELRQQRTVQGADGHAEDALPFEAALLAQDLFGPNLKGTF